MWFCTRCLDVARLDEQDFDLLFEKAGVDGPRRLTEKLAGEVMARLYAMRVGIKQYAAARRIAETFEPMDF